MNLEYSCRKMECSSESGLDTKMGHHIPSTSRARARARVAHCALRPPRTPPVEQPALRPENTPEYENMLMNQLMEHPGTSFRNILIIPNSSRNMLMELPVITPENIPTDLHENALMSPPVI